MFDSSGNLFASLDLTSGTATTGAVMQLDPSDGTVTRTISSGLPVRDNLDRSAQWRSLYR